MSVPEPHPYESALDRQIREAQEQGYFDDLPGKGKPLPGLDQPPDENWWVRDWVKREGVSAEMLLPPSIQLRKELDRLPATLQALSTEQDVREHLRELNRRIAEHLRFPGGPRVPVAPVRVEEAIARWLADRPTPTQAPADSPVRPERRRWWARRRR